MEIVDYLIYKAFNKKWKIDEIFRPFEYKIPYIDRYTLDENKDLYIYKYPSHYVRTKFIEDYNIGFSVFISFMNMIPIIGTYKAFKHTGNKKFLLGTFSYVLFSAVELYFMYTRILDVKEVVLVNGTTIRVTNWNNDTVKDIDVKDIRMIKENDPAVFIDCKDKTFNFYVMEPSYATLINTSDTYDLVFKDRRYVKYDI